MVIVLTLPGVKGQGFDSPTVHTLLCVERNTAVIAQLVRASHMVWEGPGLEPPNRFVSLGLSVCTVSSVGKSIHTQGVIASNNIIVAVRQARLG